MAPLVDSSKFLISVPTALSLSIAGFLLARVIHNVSSAGVSSGVDSTAIGAAAPTTIKKTMIFFLIKF